MREYARITLVVQSGATVHAYAPVDPHETKEKRASSVGLFTRYLKNDAFIEVPLPNGGVEVLSTANMLKGRISIIPEEEVPAGSRLTPEAYDAMYPADPTPEAARDGA